LWGRVRVGGSRIEYAEKRSSGQGCESPIGGIARERPTTHDPVKA
jgi:hypothetical protein